MHASLRHQLAQLDRALLNLLNERARLLDGVDADDPGRRAFVDDLLRRHTGPFAPEELAEVFARIDAGCLPENAR